MTKKKIILQDKSGNHLYPKTAATQVEVTANGTMLDQYLKGMVEELNKDNIVVVKEAKKVSNKLKLKDASGNSKEFDGSAGVDLSGGVNYAATSGSANVANAIKDDKGNSKDWAALDTYIGGKIGDATGEVYDYVDDKIQGIIEGKLEITIQEATEGASGAVKLAAVADVEKQNDSLDNTSDSPKAVTPNTLWRYLKSIKGSNNGIASLDETGKVPSAQLPSYVDDIVEFANKSAFPTTGESSKIYVDLSANKTYRWGGTEYVAILDSLAIGETTGTAYDGGKGKANADAISALQTRVGTAEGGITTINGEITKLKTKDERHDASISNLDTNKANVSTVTSLQNKVNGIETTANANNTKLTNIIGTGNPDTDYGDSNTTQSVALAVRAIADDEGNQFSTKYAKKTDIKEVDKTTVEGLIGVSGLTYSEDGTVTY